MTGWGGFSLGIAGYAGRTPFPRFLLEQAQVVEVGYQDARDRLSLGGRRAFLRVFGEALHDGLFHVRWEMVFQFEISHALGNGGGGTS